MLYIIFTDITRNRLDTDMSESISVLNCRWQQVSTRYYGLLSHQNSRIFYRIMSKIKIQSVAGFS